MSGYGFGGDQRAPTDAREPTKQAGRVGQGDARSDARPESVSSIEAPKSTPIIDEMAFVTLDLSYEQWLTGEPMAELRDRQDRAG